jgi:crotonobetainyl-CoA:carnitine CoA-transferase CaiB-like acyl-CoA transferase
VARLADPFDASALPFYHSPLIGSKNGQQTLLKKMRILDFTRVLSGPFATMMLGDLGAEVIKDRAPQRG